MSPLTHSRQPQRPISYIESTRCNLLGEQKAYHYAYAPVNIIHSLPIRESKSLSASSGPLRAAAISLSLLSLTQRATIALAYSSAHKNISSRIAFPKFEALASDANSNSPSVLSDVASKDSGVARLCTWPPMFVPARRLSFGKLLDSGTKVPVFLGHPDYFFNPNHVSKRAWACPAPQTVLHRECFDGRSNGSIHQNLRLNRTAYQPLPFRRQILPHTSQIAGVPRG